MVKSFLKILQFKKNHMKKEQLMGMFHPVKMPGACIIKVITAVIYGFRNKLECLSRNTRLGWKGLRGTNTQAYYKICKLRQ
jgi:hypothetical protein